MNKNNSNNEMRLLEAIIKKAVKDERKLWTSPDGELPDWRECIICNAWDVHNSVTSTMYCRSCELIQHGVVK